MHWRVGDLAKMTGLTVRTLHHYEALSHLRTADPPTDLAGWDPALMAYLDLALRALDSKENADGD